MHGLPEGIAREDGFVDILESWDFIESWE